MRLVVGATYELLVHSNHPSLGVLVYACVGECTARTVRFKREVPGYRVLVLHADGRWADPLYGFKPGQIHEWPQGANLLKGVKRVG